MQLTLKGKIKKLSNTYGIIKSNDYEEEHFFIIYDVFENDRCKIKIGDIVTFELKPNNARGSNAFKIKLLSDEKLSNENHHNSKSNTTSLINLIFNNEKPHISIEAFQKFITEGFYRLNTNNAELNDLIKLVVHDNVITDIERNFLIEKTLELKLSIDLVKKANNYLFSNNPFFDNILDIIFKDGLVKENEIAFLIEKSKETLFSSSFINYRFWQYSFSLQLDKLLEFDKIKKIIKLWYLSQNAKIELQLNKDWLITQLNILKSTKIEDNINRAFENFEKKVFPYLENKYNISKSEIEGIYELIVLDSNQQEIENTENINDVSFDSEKLIEEEEAFLIDKEKENLISKKLYKKNDLYRIFKVPKEQQKGKWHNGYCEHNGKWFIFANIGQTGHGFNEVQEFDYNNSLDDFGDLNWEAINNSNINWESIKNIKASSPFIFIRRPETKKDSWEYLGTGYCIYTLDSNPVKFKWKISGTKTIENDDITEELAGSNYKDEKSSKNSSDLIWNEKFVPIKYKNKILTLINNDEIFDASQEFLNFAYENGQKNLAKIMVEFEKITENLGK